MSSRGAVLFLLPHHDDEVFCAGHIARALSERRTVRLLWVTAGGSATARRRDAEGEAARYVLGLTGAGARSLGLPDQGALDHLDAVLQEARCCLADLRTAAPDGPAVVVFVPAYEGGHPDHDAVNLAAARLARGAPDVRVFEFPLYRRAGLGIATQAPRSPAEGAGYAALWLSRQARVLRRALVEANTTQLWSTVPLLGLGALSGRGRVELARPLPDHDYLEPPGPRPLLYELFTRRRFDEFRAAATRSPTRP